MELIPLGLHVYRRYKIVYMRLHWSRMSFIKFISINIRIRWIQESTSKEDSVMLRLIVEMVFLIDSLKKNRL